VKAATDPSTWKVSIRSSHERGNAPPGYLIAQVELVPGVLYVQSERNPYTDGQWRWLIVYWGDAEGQPSGSVCVGVWEVQALGIDPVPRAVLAKLEEVSAWFERASQP
jgi:hypothetical protein